MRHPYILDRNQTFLVVIDVQEKFRPVINDLETLVQNIKKLIQTARQLTIPILVTEQYPQGLGHLLGELVDVLPQYQPIEKVTFSCCGASSFIEAIQATGRNRALVCGIETHICVLQTALDLICRGYKVQVAVDACSSRRLADQAIGVEKLKQAGIILTGTETAIYELLERAATEEFQTLLPLFKH